MAIQKKICLRFDDGTLLNTADNHGQSVHACDKCSFIVNENMCTIFDNLPEFENHLPMETKMMTALQKIHLCTIKKYGHF